MNKRKLSQESNCIQCYTKRFDDNEYLAAFRNPHNSPNNICYLHNVYSKEMDKYFAFSKNIIAVNCIHTDIQDRANGMDEDSDFMLVTNQLTMVKCAERCYRDFYTIVNALQESGITYNNTKKDYAAMDNKFSKSRMGIGYSSNLAQLAMTYYWTELQKDNPDEKKLKELYDNFIILSVLAQVIIDGCKREYEIDGNKEIDRISKLPCMSIKRIVGYTDSGKPKYKKYDFPEFMKYTREIKYTKDGKELPQDEIDESKNKLKSRINRELLCPMNWLEDWINKIQNASTVKTIPTEHFFIKMKGKPNNRQMTKIRSIIEEYDNYVKQCYISNLDSEVLKECIMERTKILIHDMSSIKIGNIITINRLIEMSDMASATSEAASIASQYGVKINELSSLIAVATAKTRESGSETGNALKSLFINLQDTTSDPIRKAFEAVGISMTKMVNGAEKLKTPIELLKELSKAFNELPEGDTRRANILSDIGGKWHANTLSAILSDWSSFEKMESLYSQGSGSALQEAEKSANNLSGSLEKLSNDWTSFVQNIVNSDGLKTGVNLLDGLLKVVTSLSDGLNSLGSFGTIGTLVGLVQSITGHGENVLRPSF